MKNISFHPDIFHEVSEAYKWYNLKTSGLGDQFLNELEKAYKNIQSSPLSWTKISTAYRRYLLQRFPFGIIYKIEKSEIFVISVMNLSRKPGYWKKRIS